MRKIACKLNSIKYHSTLCAVIAITLSVRNWLFYNPQNKIHTCISIYRALSENKQVILNYKIKRKHIIFYPLSLVDAQIYFTSYSKLFNFFIMYAETKTILTKAVYFFPFLDQFLIFRHVRRFNPTAKFFQFLSFCDIFIFSQVALENPCTYLKKKLAKMKQHGIFMIVNQRIFRESQV